ncbi:MAG: tetratricopeptide repeat protein [Bdellovibrionales bacterium]|nr:tetratricopeptide repeat protein [Bdellovibrionales bacterium]
MPQATRFTECAFILFLALGLGIAPAFAASQNGKRRPAKSAKSRKPASTKPAPEPKNPHIVKGEKLLKAGKLDLALLEFKDANRPPNDKALVGIGKVNMKKRDYLEAIRAFELALQMEPKNVAHLVLLSEAYLASRKPTEAAAKLRLAIQIDSEYKPAHKALVAMFEYSRYERRAALEEMLVTFPGDPWATSELCRTLAEDNFFEKAIQVCADAILLSPKVPENQVYLGLMNKGSIHQKKGINMLVATAKKFPKSELAQISAGQAMDEIKNWEEALRFYRAGTKAAPKSSQAWIGLAVAQYNAGQYKKSIATFLTACPLDPKAFNEVQRLHGLLRTQEIKPWTDEYRKLMDRCTYQR